MAATMAVSMVGCAPKANDQAGNASGEFGIFDEPTTISIMVPQSNELFRNDWKVWEYMREATGADLDMQVNVTDSAAKIAIAFASKEAMPDFVAFDAKSSIDDYAVQGALVAIDDWEDQMPNWQAFWAKVDPAEKEKIFNIRRSADGKMYYPARYGADAATGLKTWLYREDIFEKHGLEVPTTYDELYEVAKKLKELYPNSYPILCENFYAHVGKTLGPAWKENFEYSEYYDYATGEWRYGAVEDTMLEIVKTFKRFYEEGLINPNFVSTPTREFSELVTTDRAFMFPCFFNRLSMYMNTMVGINDEFDLSPMNPPVANAQAGVAKIISYNFDNMGLVMPNHGDKDRTAKAIKFLDWLYSDEAIELVSWGKEGETYEVVDGKKKFILGEGEDIGNKYGFQTYGAGQAFDRAAVIEKALDNMTEDELNMIIDNVDSELNPRSWLSLTNEEKNVAATIGTDIQVYVQEITSKFMLGQLPLSEWDSYVKTIEEMGLEELLAVYETAYNRSVGK